MRVELLSDAGGLAGLAPEWRRLEEESGSDTLFVSYDWASCWWATYGAAVSGGLYLLAVRDAAGALAGLAPWYRSSRDGEPSSLRFLGSGGDTSPDYLTVLARAGEERAVAVALGGWLAGPGRGDFATLELTDMAEDGPMTAVLQEALAQLPGVVVVRSDQDVCPYLRLAHSVETHQATLPRRLRRLQGRRRRLERERGARFGAWGDVPGRTVSSGIARLAALHRLRFASQGKTHSFASPEYVAFHEAVASALAAAGQLRLYSLDVGGDAVAMLYCFRRGPTLYYFQGGFDPAWAEEGVGQALLSYVLEAAIGEGIRHYDFLKGNYAYKDEWASGRRRTVTLFAARLPRAAAPLLGVVARAARANLLRVRDELTSGAGLRGIAARAAGLGPDDGPRRYLELGVAAALYHSGAMRAALALLRRVDPEPRLVALAYHTILPAGELRDGDRPVAAARFADQLRVLGRLFEFPAPAAALAALDGPPPRSRPYPCVLTFEDGHENVLRQAWPVVRDAGRACAFFLPSGLVGSDELLWTDEVRELLMTSPLTELRLSRAGDDERHRLGAPAQRAELARRLVARLGRLTPPALATALADLRAAVEAPRLRSTQFTSLVDWREARSAARAGVILGAQVRLHPRLAPLEGTTLRAELRAARDTIARGVETPPALVAFPTVEAGAIDGRAIEAARAAGFTHGFASTGGVARGADERLALPRLEPRDEPGVLTALAIVRVLAADVLRALVGAPANVRPRVAPVRSVRASAVEVEPVSPPVRLAASGLGAAHATLGEP